MLKFYQSFIINIISVIIVQFLIDGQNYDLITNCISEIIQIPNIQNIILDTLTKKLGVEIAFTFIYNNQYISENLPEIHQKAKLYMVNNVIEELPKWVVAPFLNDKLYYQTKDPSIMQMLTASQSVQSFLVNESQLDFDYRPLYDFNVLKIENHISRCKVLKQKQFDTITQSILVSTEAFLIEINGKCFHSLLADNHDDTLGLWMPGHAFESRLGIVHADCGLKDTRFDKVDPKDVHIRQLNSVATRVCWILTFSSILFSLYINPITFETSSERSILSDANLLTQSRDEYCISVIQTSLSVLSQIEGTYLYEIVILYQQFLKIYNRELRKTKTQDLIFPRTAVMRDRIEEIIQKSATEASIAYKAIVQNNTKFSNQKELNSFDQVQDKEENQVLQLLKMSYHPKQITAVINAAAHGSVILKFVSCVKKQLNPVLSFNDNCVLFPALESVKTNFQRFLFFYEQCSEMLTIGGGCQDNKLPLLSDDVIIQQLFNFDNSETMQFAVIEEFIIAADNFIQSQQLPANPFLQGGTQVIEVQPQAFLL